MRILIYISNMHLIEAKLLILNIYKVNNMKNIDKIKETASTAEDMARKVWLAGLGAYGKGYEELTGRIEALSTDSNKFFDELVAKGEKLEAEGKVKVEEVKNDVVAKTEIESRIETVRSKLGFSNNDNDQKIEDLSAKIDALTTAVAQLTVESAAKKA
ncbi:MAG: polyhydroxyalkanoate synthesis regulator phasin [Glaciecola sp.]|jgi:polyhydroxyalkanoate synthesis regulator phasin